jgi:ATP-dependent Clp protease protease subunit
LEAIKAETAKLNADREKIVAQIALEQSKLDEKMAPRKRAVAEIQIQLEEMKAKLDLAETERKLKDDPALMELRRKNERLMMDYAISKNEVEIEAFEMRREENEVRRKTTALTMQMELQQKEVEARTYAVGKAPAYPKDPLIGKKLVLSDRTIQLNGVITGKTADNLADRIAYFNNRDPEAPVFIVIDDCPGGSVMAGYKILKAMQGSKAPVYTVVKSMAASMAACITTLSKKSFAYPNAIILHHQLSMGVMGNLTQHRENVQELEEWWKRLADPVAAKMGITRDEFIKRMYAESSSGDWNEFADDAQKLKWVDVIVEEIEETALLRDPNSQAQQPAATPGRLLHDPLSTGAVEAQDERGKPISLLPRLNPLDAYWLYNPDGYYRMQ